MGSKTALGVRDERITGAFFFDGEECFVRFGGAWTVQTFSGAALVVIDGGQKVIAGDIIEKDRGSFAAAVQANVEFGGSFGEGAGIEICAAHIEMAQPRISEF